MSGIMPDITGKIVIRRAREEDLTGLVFLLEVLFSIEKDFNFNAEKQKRGLRLLLHNPEAVVLVAERQGRIIGMCTAQLLISTAEGGLSALVEDVVILPAWQAQGTGRRLMESLREWSALQGATRIQLLADRNNTRALGFYHHIGYRPTELICLRKTKGIG
ncbi:MAG: GNAT family N-acetyltransferase [Candidatus Electrothrix aestuarii]|uniref:GNAT family N-acetyltransferase n=1 Tax=Candidatus Electrothrix aestuarii TaxID=3062594 RepID=A0AAU8LQN4_9BACT|nr:GNAT family N-acetyltransferase [Candidatus Electrothrix aestuarii]